MREERPVAGQALNLRRLADEAGSMGPVRVAVVDADQVVAMEALREAQALGFVEPVLVGDPKAIAAICEKLGWQAGKARIVAAIGDAAAAARAVDLVRAGEADAIMKGNVHTDELMRVLLDKEHGLRVPGRRVSHVFLADAASYPKLLAITDAAINISPDLNAKAQIVQNAVDLLRLLGVETPRVAVLSAVETVNPDIVSSLDAACLSLMARRGQITNAIVDGPLAFDNAISSEAAKEKGISSPVAGETDILVVPDLVSGNILAKNLEYLAGAVMAGVAVGLTAPVVLTSRADPAAARLASLAVAALIHHRTAASGPRAVTPEPSLSCSPQPEHACCPIPG